MTGQRAYDGNALARPCSRHQGGLKPMVKFEISTHINRPVAEVFKYMSDPTKLPEWNSVVEEATPSEAPVRVGTKIQVRARFLARIAKKQFQAQLDTAKELLEAQVPVQT